MAVPFALEEILIKAPTEAAAFAAGLAIHPTLSPLLRDLENFTWSEHPSKRLDLMLAAAVAAEDVAQYDAMKDEARQSGYDETRFGWAYGETLNAPGPGELIELLRRNAEVPIDFAHGLRKAKLEAQWDDAIRNLRYVRIPGPDLAYMVVRGVVPDGGTLPSSLPTTADRLQLPPQLALDTLAEAGKTGWDEERFAALVARSGLAMAPVMAAQANFRGILTDNDYALTIARGDLFPAYADPVREVSRQILTSTQYAELQIRGFYDRAARLRNTAKHGMSTEDSDHLYDVLGRSPGIHTVVTGLARGGKYPGSYANVPQPYRAEIQRSNIREEWAEIAYAARYTYPSGFQIRGEAQAGRLSPTDTREILLEIGWSPKWADHFSQAWTGGTTAAGDPHVAKAQTHLWTTTHASYKAEEIDSATATATLGTLGVSAAAIPQVLALWDAERALIRAQLSPSQIKKALASGVANPATGVSWTFQDGVNALLARGYSVADATVLLQE